MNITIDTNTDSYVQVSTPLGDGRVRVIGPTDENKNGDPEVTFIVDLPGTVLDRSWTAEIPIGTFIGGSIPQIAAKGLESAPDFPGKDFVVGAVGMVVKKVREMFFNQEGVDDPHR